MTLFDALKISHAVRRKSNPIHAGSHGTGFVDIDFFLTSNNEHFRLSVEDLLADDWEAMGAPEICDVCRMPVTEHDREFAGMKIGCRGWYFGTNR